MTTNVNNLLLEADKKVLEAWQAGALSYQTQYEKVYNIKTPERYNEKFTILKLDNSVIEVQDGAAFPESSIVELEDNTIQMKLYKSAVPISDFTEMFAQTNYGQVETAVNRKAFQFKYTMDKIAADYLNNAKSTAAPYRFSIAGTATGLIADAQPVGDTGTTYDNDVEGGFDKTTLNAARTAMLNMPTHENIIAGLQPRRLVVNPVQKQNAWQICTSTGEPESANRNNNFSNTLGLQIIEWQLFNNNSGDAVLMLADKGENGARGLVYLIKEYPNAWRVKSQTTGNWVYQIRMAVACGFVDWQGVVGINFA